MTMRSVSITVNEDDKSITITKEVHSEWPGHAVAPLEDLIISVSAQARDELRSVSADTF